MGCDQCCYQRAIAGKLFEGLISCFPDLYKALSSARIEQVDHLMRPFWGEERGSPGPCSIHRAPRAPPCTSGATPRSGQALARGWQGGAPRLGPAGHRWRPTACSRLRQHLRSRSAGPGVPRRRARRRTRRRSPRCRARPPSPAPAAAPREWRARAADRIPAESEDRLAEQGRGLVQVEEVRSVACGKRRV